MSCFRSLWRTALSADIIDINERAREAWEAYIYAKDRAQHTGALEDGLKAGRAWRTFLNLFAGAENQIPVENKILSYPYQERR